MENEMTNQQEIQSNEVDATPAITARKSNKKTIVGKVLSNKGEKTIIIKSERQVAHPLYKKYYKISRKLMAHDETNTCNIGDTVKVIESRPLSKRKRWALLEVIERAK